DVVLVLGSQNSSNSQRLAEISKECGVPAYLIDRADQIEASWLDAAETVMITAGASAPEVLVEECLDHLRERYSATIETRTIRDEIFHFPLPRELRAIDTPQTGPR
ncbi:MAG: 4-hydroxy-3-methylbut-2-enyl diphosphate reductase, partial [Planctomycetota bacterium]|nr:4-hydroxy-3-methylbut-2-enyl diphosphate reductase [Planctomycetota bacterium]